MAKESIQVKKKMLVYLVLLVVLIFAAYIVFPYATQTVEMDASPVYPEVSAAEYSVVTETEIQGTITLTIDEGVYEFISGKETQVYAYNNQIPGPLIRGKIGETKRIVVYNNLDEPTTVHWHGLQVANIQDGVSQVTQDPIMPGESFTYDIELRNPGLYWYHSHVDAHKQVESGLQGVILIEKEGDKNEGDVDEGNILVLDDVLLGSDYQLRSFDLGVMHGRFGNVFLVNGKTNPSISLENNRLRIVNTANARSFNIMFNGKPFTVIGMDIGTSEPFETTLLQIHPGERYDILLPDASSREVQMMHYTSRGQVPLATLAHNGEIVDEEKVGTFVMPFNVSEMVAKDPDYYAQLEGYRGGEYGLIWSINRKYHPDTTEVFKIQEGDIVKFRLKNIQGQPHPMHLHGQKFIVLSKNGVVEEHFGWKDTVMVSSNEEVDIVFVAEEKGSWVFHCHILEHAKAGMLSVVEVM